jgi:type I restriction enzyme S subunit
LLRSQPFIGAYNALSYGVRVGQWDMHYEDFKQILIPLPPRDEQDRIVAFLDQKTAEIDAAIAKKKRLIELLQEKKWILINRAVTRGLNPDVPMRDSGVVWIGQVPSHWEMRKMSHAFRTIGSGTTPTSGSPKFYENGSMDWINTGDLNDRMIIEPIKKVTSLAVKTYSALKIYPPGTLIVAMYGATIGKTGITTALATVNQACCCLHGEDFIKAEYAQLWFFGNKQQIVAMGYGGGQPNISQEVVQSLKIPTPPLLEQNEIIAYIMGIQERLGQLVSKTEQSLSQLREFRQVVIADAVTGRIKV